MVMPLNPLPSKETLSNHIVSTEILSKEILPYLAFNLRVLMLKAVNNLPEEIEEIRVRVQRPLIIRTNSQEFFISPEGGLVKVVSLAYIITQEDITKTLQLISQSSVYALEEELRLGFITLQGGHRIGVTGQAVLEKNKIKTLRYINGFNVRIAKEVTGIAAKVIGYLYDSTFKSIYNTLIISPPRCGKTTLLRDVIKNLSNGIDSRGIPGMTIGLIDERSEIAGCIKGNPQKDVGVRTDVLDSCPKVEGMNILLRTMGPEIIATDEIGPIEDIQALQDVLNAGVKVLATVHGKDLFDLKRRPSLKYLLSEKMFARYIILSRSSGVGTIEDILDEAGNSIITNREGLTCC